MTVTVARGGTEVGAAGSFATRSFTPTEERILVAALGLIGRQGVQRLGMAQIADAAGVARGTLYRYFPSRDHVLAAAADYDEARFRAGLDEALAHVHASDERIVAFIGYSFDFIRGHPARPLFESEPGFVLSYLLDHLPAMRGELIVRLGDALDTVPAVKNGYLDHEQLADLIVRLFGSSWIIPETDEASLVDAVRGILQI
ncbi:MAG: TetR/AcrR family transcriptional regulator [Acidimicrobiales bacterium]|nr:TetR/AcrR family transcriptional regulator [Acidimicrobiales bacterium]